VIDLDSATAVVKLVRQEACSGKRSGELCGWEIPSRFSTLGFD